MSLGETQEMFQMLIEIERLLTEIETKTITINRDLPRTQESLVTFRQLESVARRYLILANRLGFSGNVAEAIRETTRLLIVLRQAQIAAQMLRTALFVGTGPIGWAMAGASLGLTAANVVAYADVTYDGTWGT